ncbi:MAG: CusA/CzcA family heavy metal efflux RND transporter [Sandaracinaceae bacterium]
MIARLIELSARYRALVLALGVVLAGAGWAAMGRLRLDAIPDLSDPQVIVFTEWPGRSPTLVEDQVTYPIVTALLGAPDVVEVRGQSMPGMSFVYVVFDEGTDPYWARSRVLEYLSSSAGRLPDDVRPQLGPDASGVGWIYQYVVVDERGAHDLGALRALHDFSIRYALASVRGVAEVATVGGAMPEYQVTLDPARLHTLGLTVSDVAGAIRGSNGEVGGRTIEISEREAFVRGRGYLGGTGDLEEVVVRTGEDGAPLRVRDVGEVRLGGALRRGATDWNGEGEVVSGIVVMRHGENALEVIERVEERIAEIAPSLPEGVAIRPVYSRAPLVERAIETLRHALGEEMLVVAVVILVFLLHVRSALLPIVSLPLAVLVAFIPMALFGVPATIMSLGGIAIAIGATVDAEIVMIEAAHKRLEQAPADLSPDARRALLAKATAEVTPAIFFSLLIVAVSFLPVFGLTGQAGRLFIPLAFTKTCVMLSAALLSVTVAPALRDLLLQGRIRPEAQHPVSRLVRRFYAPFVHVALASPRTTVLIGVFAVLSALPLVPRLGTEFMPTLDEGDLLYMPTTLPGISVEEARHQLALQDRALAEIPEVLAVLGKVGRAETPTDPAPLSMAETVVRLRPRSEWRTRYERRFWHGLAPRWARPVLARLWPEFRPMTREELVADMNQRVRPVGWTNAFTQPIRNRIDMLATGIRTPLGVKIYGHDLGAIERAGTGLEATLRAVPGTRSAFFERQEGGLYLDVVPDRVALGRYGLRVEDVDRVVEGAIGAEDVTTTVEGRLRLGVTVRYAEDFRASPEAIAAALVPLPNGGSVRLDEVARVTLAPGPSMIRDESGLLVGYVYVDVDERTDLGGYVARARAAVDAALAAGSVALPEGGRLRWTGQYEQLVEMEARMRLLVPLALVCVVVLLWLQFRNFVEVLIVLCSVPFALVGSVWALYLLGYHLSTAVWVGMIALVGLAAQTGVVMIVYIDHAYEARLSAGRIRCLGDIVAAHAEGTIERVRPKLMTVGTMLIGLVPLLWAEGSGADVMRRIAAPMVGGLLTSAFLTLEIIPVVYTYWRFEELVLRRLSEHAPAAGEELGVVLRVVQVGAGVLVASSAARLYLDASPWLVLAQIAGASALVLGALAYLVSRRAALSLLPDRASLYAAEPSQDPPSHDVPPAEGGQTQGVTHVAEPSIP